MNEEREILHEDFGNVLLQKGDLFEIRQNPNALLASQKLLDYFEDYKPNWLTILDKRRSNNSDELKVRLLKTYDKVEGENIDVDDDDDDLLLAHFGVEKEELNQGEFWLPVDLVIQLIGAESISMQVGAPVEDFSPRESLE